MGPGAAIVGSCSFHPSALTVPPEPAGLPGQGHERFPTVPSRESRVLEHDSAREVPDTDRPIEPRAVSQPTARPLRRRLPVGGAPSPPRALLTVARPSEAVLHASSTARPGVASVYPIAKGPARGGGPTIITVPLPHGQTQGAALYNRPTDRPEVRVIGVIIGGAGRLAGTARPPRCRHPTHAHSAL